MKTNLFLAVTAIALTACSNVNAESKGYSSETRNPGNFFGLIVNTNANVILSQGESTSVKLEGDSKLIDGITTEIKNGVLVINGSNARPVTIYVTVNDINLIEVNGSARIYANQLINSDLLLLKINGNGIIKIDVRSLSLGLIVKGKGKIIVSGSTGDSLVKVYGGGNVIAHNLNSFRQREEIYNHKGTWSREYSSTARQSVLKLHE